MAGKAKKGDAKQTIALAMQEVQKFRTELARFFATLKPGDALLQENINKLKELRDKVKEGERNVKLLTEANNALACSQDKNAKSTHGFVSQLMQVELSIRRIQSGFDRMMKAATFAKDPALKWNDYRLMAEAVGETARQLDAMDKSARKFNVSKGEVSKWATDMKTELVGLSFGEYGGRLGKAMQRYGLNLSGHEDARGILAELRRVALELPKNLQPLFMRDMGISANFHKWLTHGTDEEFFKDIKDNEIAEQRLKNLNDNSEAITRKVGRNQVEEESKEQTVVSEVADTTKYALDLKSTINKVLLEHPTLIALKPLLEGVAGLGSVAFGSAGLINLLKTAGISASVTGATAGAGTAAMAGGATATVGPIAAIAIGITALAAGWWAVKSIAKLLQDHARGRSETETDEQATAREDKELDEMQNGGFYTQEEIDEKKKEIAENRAKRKKNRELIEAQNKIIEKMKTELLSESEWEILASKTGVDDLDKKITDKLGGVGDETYNSGRRNVSELKTKNFAQVESAKPHEDFVSQKVVAFENGRNFRNLLDLFKAENAGKLGDKKQQEALLHYFDKALYPAEVKQFKKFVEDPMDGYMIPSTIRHGAEDLEGYHSEPVLVGGEWQTDSTRANQEKKEALNGVLDAGAVASWERWKAAEDARVEREIMMENMKKRQLANGEKFAKPMAEVKKASEELKKPIDKTLEASGVIIVPSVENGNESSGELEKLIDKVKEVSEAIEAPVKEANAASEEFKKPFEAIDVVNDAADEAQLPGGAVNPQTVTNNENTNVKKEMPITVSNNTEVKIVQNVGTASDAGEAYASVQNKVNSINMNDISNMIAQKIQLQLDDVGAAYAPVC